MLEVAGERHFRESIIVEDDETDAAGCPSHGSLVALVLGHKKRTLRNW